VYRLDKKGGFDLKYSLRLAYLLVALSACQPTQIDQCPLSTAAHPLENPGGFYRCVEGLINQGNGCGEDGYLLGYAAKYAERYMWEIYPTLNTEGQRFLDLNLVCLQTVFRDTVEDTWSCERVAEFGFQSHAACYLSSGICELSLSNRLTILMAVDTEDLNQPGQEEAFAAVAAGCEN
jgi:hypothetical protein